MKKLETITLEDQNELAVLAERLEQQEHMYHSFPEAGTPFWYMPSRETKENYLSN